MLLTDGGGEIAPLSHHFKRVFKLTSRWILCNPRLDIFSGCKWPTVHIGEALHTKIWLHISRTSLAVRLGGAWIRKSNSHCQAVYDRSLCGAKKMGKHAYLGSQCCGCQADTVSAKALQHECIFSASIVSPSSDKFTPDANVNEKYEACYCCGSKNGKKSGICQSGDYTDRSTLVCWHTAVKRNTKWQIKKSVELGWDVANVM